MEKGYGTTGKKILFKLHSLYISLHSFWVEYIEKKNCKVLSYSVKLKINGILYKTFHVLAIYISWSLINMGLI